MTSKDDAAPDLEPELVPEAVYRQEDGSLFMYVGPAEKGSARVVPVAVDGDHGYPVLGDEEVLRVRSLGPVFAASYQEAAAKVRAYYHEVERSRVWAEHLRGLGARLP